MNKPIRYGDTVQAEALFSRLEATVAKRFGRQNAPLQFSIAGVGSNLSRAEVEAWITQGVAEGYSMIEYGVADAGDQKLLVDLVAIAPIDRGSSD